MAERKRYPTKMEQLSFSILHKIPYENRMPSEIESYCKRRFMKRVQRDGKR
jgi:hypothetical protein